MRSPRDPGSDNWQQLEIVGYSLSDAEESIDSAISDFEQLENTSHPDIALQDMVDNLPVAYDAIEDALVEFADIYTNDEGSVTLHLREDHEKSSEHLVRVIESRRGQE